MGSNKPTCSPSDPNEKATQLLFRGAATTDDVCIPPDFAGIVTLTVRGRTRQIVYDQRILDELISQGVISNELVQQKESRELEILFEQREKLLGGESFEEWESRQ